MNAKTTSSCSNCIKCRKSVSLTQKATKCTNCNGELHARCSKKFIVHHRNKTFCFDCLKTFDIMKYNPFYEIITAPAEDIEKFYNSNQISTDALDTIYPLSEILENCTVNSVEDFNNLSTSLRNYKDNKDMLSYKFLNIDGNASNYDTPLTTLSIIRHQFSVVGLCETNTDPSCKELYKIPHYNSIYQNRQPGKRKGSGTALYIHKSLSFSIIDVISICNENIETLFISINNFENEVQVGVVYRPPNGNDIKFNEDINGILSSFGSKNSVIIMGDFNINMFTDTKHRSCFEENVLCNGFSPTISVATHKKPNCHPSCIDNILVNTPDDIVVSGVIDTHITHHRSLFLLSRCSNIGINSVQAKTKKDILRYDFKTENLEKLKKLLLDHLYSRNTPDFEFFTSTFMKCMNDTCQRKHTIASKRNRIQNPWITTALINSIHKRDHLYKKWKRTLNCVLQATRASSKNIVLIGTKSLA